MSEHQAGATDGGEPGTAAGSGQGIDRSRAWLTGIGLGALVLGAMVVAFVIGTNYSDEPAPITSAAEETPALPQDLSGPGRDMFVASCGGCHALADAESSGTVGPDLDKLAPDAAVITQAIAQGGTGSGVMPPGILTGEDAEQVTEYIVAATGGS